MKYREFGRYHASIAAWLNTLDPRARRFREYVERLTVAVGHADRHAPMRAYLTGLCLPGERKSIEPMAARVDPRHVRARHQSMHHFVANAPWDGGAVLAWRATGC